MEAVYRDYGPKGVKFYFVYKSLAHPELVGDYVQAFTLDERLMQARRAATELGATIPWLVDGMANQFREQVGKRANSEFILDPDGVIVRKRALSDPAQLRRDLEQFVGPVKQITREEDVELKMKMPLRAPAAHGILPRLQRTDMTPLVTEPKIEPNGPTFFAKLRAEADAELLKDGKGQLYLGFFLDPIHNAHWNNLTKPLSFQLKFPEDVVINPRSGSAPHLKVAADGDPREFILDVEAWPKGRTVQLTTQYFACVGEESCFSIRQSYSLTRERDRFAGRAFWEPTGIADRMLLWDGDGDGLLNREEMRMSEATFKKFDLNGDGQLDQSERESVRDWLNRESRYRRDPKQ
jgi:hypothetical protein